MCSVSLFSYSENSTILQDVETMKQEIVHCQEQQVEKKELLQTLEQERVLKCEELERIQVSLVYPDNKQREIQEVEERMKECEGSIADLDLQTQQEQATIDRTKQFKLIM